MILASVLAQSETHRELFIPPIAFGGIALIIFMVLLYVVTRFDPDR